MAYIVASLSLEKTKVCQIFTCNIYLQNSTSTNCTMNKYLQNLLHSKLEFLSFLTFNVNTEFLVMATVFLFKL